jgi:hypothetical protein
MGAAERHRGPNTEHPGFVGSRGYYTALPREAGTSDDHRLAAQLWAPKLLH